MNQKKAHADFYNITLQKKTPKECFAELLIKFATPKRKCVILVDEYDKPITDYIQKPEIAEEHTKSLKGFYRQLKSADPLISHHHRRFQIWQSGYFSDLNNLNDVSMDAITSKICGYTQEELEFYFAEYIEKGTQQFNTTKTELIEGIK